MLAFGTASKVVLVNGKGMSGVGIYRKIRVFSSSPALREACPNLHLANLRHSGSLLANSPISVHLDQCTGAF